MRAFVYHEYGPPDVLRCEEMPMPVPGDNQVLIRVRAAGVNPLDTHLMLGKPFLARLVFGFPRPRNTQPGRDVAGVVEAAGKDAACFQAGDSVFGMCAGKKWTDKVDGALAEFACTLGSSLVLKPANISSQEAAFVPIAAITALQALRDHGELKPGQRVLIHGPGGGVGSYAVQLAKILGAHVTAVSSRKNFARLQKLGADELIDYDQTDFTRTGSRYDVILDCFTNHSLMACRRALTDSGVYVVVGGPTGNAIQGLVRMLAGLFVAQVGSRFDSRKLKMFIAKMDQNDLSFLRERLADGSLVPVVDRCFGFDEAPEALRYQLGGHPRGKVVVSMS